MGLTEMLMATLGVPLAKFLLKNYLGEPADAVGGSLLDIAKQGIKEYTEQREAQRQFERLGDKIVARLVPHFEQADQGRDINPRAVALQLSETLEGRISAEYFLSRDLDPVKLSNALRVARPIPENQFSQAEIALYNRALDEAVRYVVAIAAQLPKFEENQARLSLQRLSRLADDLEQVLGSTQRIERMVGWLVDQANAESLKVQRYEADYRQAVIRNLDRMDLFGADLQQEARRYALSVAYVSLNLRGSSAQGNGEFDSHSVERVLDSLTPDSGRFLIRGEAGSGKSTLLRWTALQAAGLEQWSDRLTRLATPTGTAVTGVGLPRVFKYEDRLYAYKDLPRTKEQHTSTALRSRPSLGGLLRSVQPVDEMFEEYTHHNWRGRIPFLIRLRDCVGGALPSPEEFPLFVAKELGTPPAEWVLSVLREGRGLVLLDGVDEIPNLHRNRLRDEVEAIIEAYPQNYFLLSTRPAAVPEGWLARMTFREASVEPMSDADKARFIEQWHEAVTEELQKLGRPDNTLRVIASELIEKLPDHPPVSRLASNPLLCAMICALHRERNRKLPETQRALYEAVCEMLLHRREFESELRLEEFPEHYTHLGYDQKRAIVQDIAHYMVRNEESVISRTQAAEVVESTLKGFPGSMKGTGPEVLETLIERSGVLRESRPGYVDFIHNTLKEYLAADRFADDNDIGRLCGQFTNPAWENVVLFAASTQRRGVATELIRRVLGETTGEPQAPNPSPEDIRNRQLFAIRLRAAAIHVDPNLDSRLENIESSLFPPRTMRDAEVLASGGDAAAERLRYRKRMSAREAAASIRTLRLIGTPMAQRYLLGYAADPRKGVWQELAQAINPLEIRAVQESLMRGERLSNEVRKQIADLSPTQYLSDLQSLDLTGARISDIAPLASLTNLQSLNLSETHVSNIASLTSLSNLQSLNLFGTQISDIAPLVGLTNLQSLNLSQTNVSNIAPLASLTNLRSLYIAVTQVSDLAPLDSLYNLDSLNIYRTQVSDFVPLANMTNLKYLALSGAQISGVAILSNLTKLEILTLSGTEVGDISPLAKLTNLQSLSLFGTQISDIAPLANLAKLRSLDLFMTKVSDVTPLASLINLESLDLSATPVSDIKPLANLPMLKFLDIRGSQVDDVSSLKHKDDLILTQ